LRIVGGYIFYLSIVAHGLNAHTPRSTTRGGGASLSLAGVRSWASGRESTTVARSLRRARERKQVTAMGATTTATEEDEGEWGQPHPGLSYL
jgi:hypothetical protein